MNEKIIEYGVMFIISLSGWIFGIGHRVLSSTILEKAAGRFVSKELYEKELQNVRESLRVIEAKIDRLMEG